MLRSHRSRMLSAEPGRPRRGGARHRRGRPRQRQRTPAPAALPPGLAVDTLVIANAVKVDTLDPEANSVNESIWLDQNLYSRLLQPNATGTGLLPDLATSWDISARTA